ncbi:MAG: AI-2E family transporter [Deltaproteobacteria bacterium]|nr:AI-2E family transporter [Deltaproteobacteria bacterium]
MTDSNCVDKKQGARFFLIFLLCSLLLIVTLFWTFLSAIILAMLIVSIFYSLYAKVNHLFRKREVLASLCFTVLILITLIIPMSWFVGTLSNEAYDFYRTSSSKMSLSKLKVFLKDDPVWAQRFKKINDMTGLEITPETIEDLGSSIGKNIGLFLYNQISSIASNLLNFLIQFFLMALTMYYLFKDGDRLKRYFFELLPVPANQLERLTDKFHEMGRAIVVGNGLSGIVQGILGGLGFYFFGLSSPFLWGTVISFMAFLPIIGASAVFIPTTVILFLHGNSGLALGFLIYNLSYSSVIEYLVKPRLIGQGMQMNALLVFVGIIGGIKVFGILGIVYGPLIITVFLTLAEIYRLEYRDKAV